MQQPMLMVRCPNCFHMVVIEEVNCGIFRHGMLSDGTPLPPHASKEECMKAKTGCGQPFQLVKIEGSGVYVAKKCGFI